MEDHNVAPPRSRPGALFSTDAADYAEVVPVDPPRGPDSLWSTRANHRSTRHDPGRRWGREHVRIDPPVDEDVLDGDAVEGELADDWVDLRDGLDSALSYLHDDERARVQRVVTVGAAMLDRAELLVGAVTGWVQGHPALVSVTSSRVVVVTDRGQQVMAEIYAIDGSLLVHARQADEGAVLSFADHERWSTVEGIIDVDTAIALAEEIGGPVASGPDPGAGTAGR